MSRRAPPQARAHTHTHTKTQTCKEDACFESNEATGGLLAILDFTEPKAGKPQMAHIFLWRLFFPEYLQRQTFNYHFYIINTPVYHLTFFLLSSDAIPIRLCDTMINMKPQSAAG